MPAAIYYRPFFLIRKGQRIKADIKGLPHQATAPPPCRPGQRAQPSQSLAFPHTVSVVITSILNGILPPLPSSRFRLRGMRRPAISYTARVLSPCRRFASLRGTKQSIYDRFAEDLFPKKIQYRPNRFHPDDYEFRQTKHRRKEEQDLP